MRQTTRLLAGLACATTIGCFGGFAIKCESAGRAPIAPELSAVAQARIRQIVKPAAERCPSSIVVGIVDGERQSVLSFTNTKYGAASDASVFELASVTKTFAGLLLAQAVARGDVKLEQPVAEVIGTDQISGANARQINFKQLAAHTAALPDWPTNRGATTSPYSLAQFQSYLKSAKLRSSPGTEVSYSNTGYVLLGYALSKLYGDNFETLVQERICKPLGMTETRVQLSPAMNKRVIGGHNQSGAPMPSSSPTAGGGADGLRSTGRDMLKFVNALARPSKSPFRDAIKVMYGRYYKHNDKLDIGLGMYRDTETGIIWKGGFLAGYRTYIGVIPGKELGVVVLANRNAFPSPQLGEKVLLELASQRSQ